MKFYICNLGCKVNTYESNVMSETLIKDGYKEATSEEAELVIVNTCSVTDVALKKSLKMIRRFNNQNKFVVVTGCASQIEPNLFDSFENVIIVLGNSGKSKINTYLKKYFDTKQKIIDIKNLNEVSFEEMKLNNFNQTRAFVKVEDGCENFCSYCIIPYTRGKVRSRSVDSVLEEVKNLALNGHKEVVLAGIHTGHYNYEDKTLSDLLDLICSIDKIERVRISSIEITELDEKFLNCLKNNKKIVDHIHIPLQAGSDKVLKDMNRKYDMNYFFEKIKQIKDIRPNMNITTDVIVGFPTETEENFYESIENIKKLEFGKVHVFPYSPRKGTKAYELKEISIEEKKKRSSTLLEFNKELEQNFLNKHLDKEVYLLPEVYKDSYIIGHTDDYALVKVKGNKEDLNKIIKVHIYEINNPYCIGEKI